MTESSRGLNAKIIFQWWVGGLKKSSSWFIHPKTQDTQLFCLSKFATTFAQKFWNAPCQRFQTHSRKPNYAMLTPPFFGIWPSSPTCTRLRKFVWKSESKTLFSSGVSRFIVLIWNPRLWGRTSYLHHKTCDAFWGFVLIAWQQSLNFNYSLFFGEKRMNVVEGLCWRTPSRNTWRNPLAKDMFELVFFLKWRVFPP